MSKIAFIFPGQGAQMTGMGSDFYEAFPICREIYENAAELAGFAVPEVCFKEDERLNVTEYTQTAILTTSIAMLRAFESFGIKPDVCAGLSLGEYAALTACGVMSFEDACRVVRQRGILMQEAVPAGEGAMAAVLALAKERIEEICTEVSNVQIANYNCPGQIVISGRTKAVEEACEKLKTAGAKRTVLLNVSGPFHSDMLKEAGEKLGAVLEPIALKEHSIPYVTNVTAEYVHGTEEVKELLKRQVYSSVRWQQSVENMIQNGVDIFIEIGPGKTLSAFVKKISRDVKVFNIEKTEDMEKAVQGMHEKADI